MTHANENTESCALEPRESIGGTAAVGVAEHDHSEILDQLSEYMDGSLSAGDTERVQQHLDGCGRCQAFYRTLLKVVSATRQMSGEPLGEEDRRRLIGDTLNAAT